jgi:hypothetical protein
MRTAEAAVVLVETLEGMKIALLMMAVSVAVTVGV